MAMIKLHNIITFILIAYIAIMAFWARDLIIVYNKYLEFFFLIAISLVAIFLLRYTIKCRDRKNNDEE
jgi:membrane protein implicated in regulation of membrane protease activity